MRSMKVCVAHVTDGLLKSRMLPQAALISFLFYWGDLDFDLEKIIYWTRSTLIKSNTMVMCGTAIRPVPEVTVMKTMHQTT